MSDAEQTAPTQLVNVTRDPLADTIIGERYRVLGRIGEGGMGTVFRVEHIHMKKVLALKLLRGEFSNVPDATRRFEREAQSASRLSHPNIISVTDFGHGGGGELFLVMEYVGGEPLSDVLAREKRLDSVHDAVIHRSALAAHALRGHPLRPMGRTLLFVKVFSLHTLGVPFQRERPVVQVGQKRGSDAMVIV